MFVSPFCFSGFGFRVSGFGFRVSGFGIDFVFLGASPVNALLVKIIITTLPKHTSRYLKRSALDSRSVSVLFGLQETKKAPEGAFSFKLLTITRQKRSLRLEVQLGYLLLVQQMDLLALQHV